MSLPKTILDREFQRFRDTGNPSQTKVAVIVEQDSPIPTELVESISQQILKASDRERDFTWLDFGTKNERISIIQYTAPSVGSYVLTSTFNYTLVSGKYRLDNETRVLS